MRIGSLIYASWFTAAFIIGVGLLFGSCSKLSPSGFWLMYQPGLITQNYSDQGPWGGIRWVHWVSPTSGAFTPAETMRFATSQGWSCQEPIPYSAERMRIWQYSDKPVFPLFSNAPEEPPNNTLAGRFPRHIDDDSVVMKCRTQWTRVEPGNASATAAFGYVLINSSGTRMAVYHLWGEM